MNLLIADDELMIRKGILRLDWASAGIDEVYCVNNGEEAKELLLTTPIDIGLFDIRMPGATGLDLARLIQERSLDTAVILLTGFSEFEYARDGIRYGVKEYLLKPVVPRELAGAVKRVAQELEKERAQKELLQAYGDGNDSDISEQVRKYFSHHPEEIRQIIEEISSRYDDSELSLSKVAEGCHMAPEYLSRKLKRETGHSYVSILNAIRLAWAVNYLKDGKRVSEVLDLTGYNDRGYFSQLFRRTFGFSPSEVRKNMEGAGMSFHEVMALADKKGRDGD